jgi:hypothetical protein
MPLKKHPGEHPRLEDLNHIYGSRQVRKLAAHHKRLGRKFKVGDHVQHVPGIETKDIRYWRIHMRSMPELLRKLLQETIHFSLSAAKPLPIEWVVKPRRPSGWTVAVSQKGQKLVVEVTPPPTGGARAKSR